MKTNDIPITRVWAETFAVECSHSSAGCTFKGKLLEQWDSNPIGVVGKRLLKSIYFVWTQFTMHLQKSFDVHVALLTDDCGLISSLSEQLRRVL